MTQPNATAPVRVDAAALIGLLRQQLALYQQLGDLSRQQGKLLDGGAVDGVLTVLSQRQKLIEALTRLGEQIDPYRDRLPALWPTLASDDSATLTALLDQIQTLVKGILDQDGRDRGILESVRNQTGAELKQTSCAGRAVNAYAAVGRAAATPRFADRQG